MSDQLFDTDTENAILGTLLLYGWMTEQVIDTLEPRDFYSQKNQDIYQAILTTFERTPKAVEWATVAETLRRSGHPELGEEAAILEVQGKGKKPTSLSPYAAIVRDFAVRRDMELAGKQITAASRDYTISAYELPGLADGYIKTAERSKNTTEPDNMGEIIEKALAASLTGAVVGLQTGYPALDEKTGGFRKGELSVIAGRPSMGKTSLGLNIASRCATAGATVLFISLETPDTQLAANLVAIRCRINSRAFQSGKMTEDEYDKASAEMHQLKSEHLLIADCPSLSPSGLRSMLRTQSRSTTLDLVIIDYLQLMETPQYRENRQQEVAGISRALKSMAKEYNIPVIAMAQLNRGLERRENRRPVMSDLRESGAIEQDADVILLLHRESYYEKTAENDGLATVIVAKNRNGPTGDVTMCFFPEHMRFESLTWAKQMKESVI